MSNPTARVAHVPFHHPDCFYISGRWVEPAGGKVIDVIDSSSEDVAYTVAEAQAADIDRAVAAARATFDRSDWAFLPPVRRAEYLSAIAAGIRERAKDIAQVWATESGMLYAQAVAGATNLGNVWERYAALAGTFPFIEQGTPGEGNVGVRVREPVGVVGAIIPWNGPPILLTHKVAPAILAGCTIVLKASPEAPGMAYIFAEICDQAGLPDGVFNFVTADREVSELLVRHSGVDKIAFTGSTAAGRKIAALCGERLARCTLELGGKSAALVLEDYDVAKAAATIAARAVSLTGQVCAALTRIVVPRARHDDMVDALSARFADVQVGSAFEPTSQMGPLATQVQRARVEGYIAKGKAQGARLAAGGGRPAHLDRGYFIEPTVFGNVENRMVVAQEEIFGPVVSVIAADDEEHAIAIANDTIYGLNNSVFTSDADHAFAIARRLRSGTVGHNSMRSDFNLGFGGFKCSGIGREGGSEGLRHYLESKTVIMDELPVQLGLS